MIISRTPVRISFVGGGTDFYDFYKDHAGAVISTAINKFVYVIIKSRFDDDITVNYKSVAQHVKSVDEISHTFVREILKYFNVTKGIDIILLSDVPFEGSGLGSSSSLIVGLIKAISTYAGKALTTEEIAQLACHIEIDILKYPIGKQDQYIAAYGGFKYIKFNTDSSVKITDLSEYISKHKLNELENSICLHYIPSERNSYNILTEQKDNISSKIENLLNIKSLTDSLLHRIISSEFKFIDIISVINLGWKNKKLLSKDISNPTIEKMIEYSLECGSMACKVAGAGGGGFLISFVYQQDINEFRKNMNSKYKELKFKFEPEGTKIIFNQ